MTQPLGSSQGTPHPLFSLPRELLLEITTLVNTGDTPRAAAINAVRWGQVSCFTHLITHEPSIKGAINQARERHESDKALVIIWNSTVANQANMFSALGFNPRDAAALQMHDAQEIRNWMADPNPRNARLLRIINQLEITNHRMKVIPLEINKFHRLQALNLDRNQITQITSQTFADFPQLLDLTLSCNKIAQIACRAFAGCPKLQELNLECNQLTQIDDQTLAGCTALHRLRLCSNQIAQIAPSAFDGCSVLQELQLRDNQLLCAFNSVKFRIKFNAFSKYVCRSKWAAFHKAVSEGSIPMSVIAERLQLLKDRNLIYEMVYFEAKEAVERGGGVFSDGGDLQWGENHVCGNEAVLYRALKRAVCEKFNRLLAEQKCAVHRRICEIAREDGALAPDALIDDDLRWGEKEREENILRFIDAMAGL